MPPRLSRTKCAEARAPVAADTEAEAAHVKSGGGPTVSVRVSCLSTNLPAVKELYDRLKDVTPIAIECGLKELLGVKEGFILFDKTWEMQVLENLESGLLGCAAGGGLAVNDELAPYKVTLGDL
ncbi:hypothetical protein NPX13_g3604 [Xylaria arbuscula]|uniref:Uncharacterized protein n=1 Tax=Xylaria arbuscula TaxID=114810 RepID=A0A9W8TMP0_9PEZI|nr:hypothetical protein NPX13_g3604 [Xylaria arbuscula]